MPIQFNCPYCHQPIEVDDEWGGEHVGCPFCQHVVTAPTLSTLQEKQLARRPVARSASGATVTTGASRLPEAAEPTPARSNRFAIYGFVFSLLGLLFYVVLSVVAGMMVFRNLPSTATPAEVQEEVLEILAASDTSWPKILILATTCLSLCSWVTGVTLSIMAVSRPIRCGRGLAIAGIVCSGILPFIFLLGFLLTF